MAKQLNLKAIFSADTSGIKKGSKEATDAIKDFDASATGMLDQFTGLFNTSFGQISKTLSTFKGGLLTMNKALNSSSKAAGGTSTALKALKVALASTGIGALIVALGSLVAYFTKSQRGAEKLQRILAPFKQTFAFLTDLAVKLGEGIVWCFENPKKAIQGFIDLLKGQIINRITALINSFKALGKIVEGIFTLSWDKIKEGAKDYGKAVVQGVTGLNVEQQQNALNKLGATWAENSEKIKQRNQLLKEQQEFQYKELEAQEKIANLQNQINEARLNSENREKYSAAERLKYNKQAIELTNQLFDIEKGLAEKRHDFKVRENALSESMFEDLKAEKELKMAITAVDTQRNSALKEMTNKNAELTKQAAAQRLEKEKLLAIEKQIQALNERKAKDLTLIDPAQQENVKNFLSKEFEVETLIKPTIDIPNLEEAKQTLIDFSKEIQSTLTDLTVGFAEGIAGLMTGTGGMKNVMANIIKIIANGIQKIGAMLISLGLGMIKLKVALSNPYTAIAAGAAMVALATAVSAAIGNTISGMTSGGISSVNPGAEVAIPLGNTAQMNSQNKIEVTGTLTGDGDKLVAVINNTNNNNNLKY